MYLYNFFFVICVCISIINHPRLLGLPTGQNRALFVFCICIISYLYFYHFCICICIISSLHSYHLYFGHICICISTINHPRLLALPRTAVLAKKEEKRPNIAFSGAAKRGWWSVNRVSSKSFVFTIPLIFCTLQHPVSKVDQNLLCIHHLFNILVCNA